MEDLRAGLSLLTVAAFVIGVVAIFKPLPKLGLTTRGRAGLAIVGSLIAMGIVGAIFPSEPTATASVPAEAAKPKADPKVELVSETKAVWEELKSAVQPCDTASKKTADAFDKTTDAYALYGVVTDAQEKCKQSWQTLNRLDPPSSASGEAKTALKEALDGCSTAYWMKYHAYEDMAEVINGDTRPSAVAKANSSMQDASNAQLMCVASFMSAGEKAGVPIAELVGGDEASAS